MDTQHQSTSVLPHSGSQQVTREPLIIEAWSAEEFVGDHPQFPEYSDCAARVESFKRGVVGQGQTAEELADAGWFYVGPNDKVCCFHCGGNNRDWETGEDPWEEHTRWHDYCPYIRSNMPSPRPERQLDTGSYQIEPREVTARMDTPIVRYFLDMGYSHDSVKAVIEERLSTRGDDFLNAEKLLKAIFILEGAVATAPLGRLDFGVGNIPVNGPYTMGRDSQGLVLILRDFDSFGVKMRGENGEYSAEVSSVIRLMPSTARPYAMGRDSQGLVLILRDFDSFGVKMRGENGEYSAEVSSVIRLS